jgi:hypothetical protein
MKVKSQKNKSFLLKNLKLLSLSLGAFFLEKYKRKFIRQIIFQNTHLHFIFFEGEGTPFFSSKIDGLYILFLNHTYPLTDLLSFIYSEILNRQITRRQYDERVVLTYFSEKEKNKMLGKKGLFKKFIEELVTKYFTWTKPIMFIKDKKNYVDNA